MMRVEVGINKRVLGRTEVVNKGVRYKNGDTLYAVKWTGPYGEVFEFEVRHNRTKGAWALAEKVCRHVHLRVEKFYSLPKDKVTPEGLVRNSDIPERYREAFGKWLGVATVSLLPRKSCPDGCLDVDLDKQGETAFNVSDVYGFLAAMRYGKHMMFD